MEVYDAELYGIREAATHALRYCQTTSKRCDVWTFTDNQAAIMRVANLKPGPGQETAVAVAKASNALKALNSTITVQWVPGHTNVPGNEAADRLAKKATNNDLSCLPEAYGMREYEERMAAVVGLKGGEYYEHFRLKPDKIFQTPAPSS